jgi:TrmH family RNA methyltransferase
VKKGVPVVEAACSPRLTRSPIGRELLDKLNEVASVFECSDEVLERLSSVKTHQGVVAIFRRPRVRVDDLLGEGEVALVVIAAGLRDPGNLGALVRTAEASGATGVMCLAEGADPYRDKAVRGSAGSVFRLPTLGGVSAEQALDMVRRKQLQLVVADRVAENVYHSADFRLPTALVLGAETGGIPDSLTLAANHRVRIPMRSGVESLNVAVAAGVLLYEARRQRG